MTGVDTEMRDEHLAGNYAGRPSTAAPAVSIKNRSEQIARSGGPRSG